MELQEYCYSPSTVFDGRNQSYGAYVIRKTYDGRVTIATILVLAFSFFGLAGPVIWKALKPKEEIKDDTKEVVAEIKTMEELPKEPEKPQPEINVPPPPQIETIKFLPPEVVPEKEVDKKETPPDVKKLDEGKAIADKSQKGDTTVTKDFEDLDKKAGSKTTGDGDGDDKNKIYEGFAQVDAQFPGGYTEFQKAIKNEFKYPRRAKTEKIQGKLSVQFVIERDGSITEPTIISKPLGYGLEEEAIRTFKKIMASHKWIPAEQNGKQVRLRKTMPINLKLE